ncbi:hypothetical protein C6A37_11640, partial [Desulfobacteraceae bacterium SEEP-SAG9]
GAMISLLFYGLINLRKPKHIKIAIVVTLLISLIFINLLPGYLKGRYLGLLITKPTAKNTEFSNRGLEEHKKSAEARLTGLIDGWNLAKIRPVFGFGPNSSPLSRKLV